MGKILKNKKILFCFIFLGIFGIISGALALELKWPNSPGGTQLTDASTLPQLVQYIYEWGIAVGGLATFIALVSAGFQHLTSVGDPAKMADARGKITSAVLGLVLLLSSWLILNTINPELTTFQSSIFEVSPPDIPSDMDFTSGEEPQCDFAKLYPEKNFGGEERIIQAEEHEEFAAKSVEAYYIDEDGEEAACGSDACGCYLEVAAGSWFFGWGCGDVIGYIPAFETDITRRTQGISIKCVRLLLPTTQ